MTEFENKQRDLTDAVVGQKIVLAEYVDGNTQLTLDSGRVVLLMGYGDCCAWAETKNLVVNLQHTDHVITSVTSTEDGWGKETWFILADMVQLLSFDVAFNEGSGYYSYGIEIEVSDPVTMS